MKTTATIILLLLFTFSAFAQCEEKSSNYSFEFEGKNYLIVLELLSWADAASCASANGAYLAEINSQAEQDTIYSALQQSTIASDYTDVLDGGGIAYVWIGGNDREEEGTWVWNGNNNEFSTHFFTGTWQDWEVIDNQFIFWGGASEGDVDEPDNFNEQDGLGLALENWPFGQAGEWNDIDDSNELYFVIEWDAVDTPINTTLVTNPTIDLYPNPAQNQFSINTAGNKINTLTIYNALGEQTTFKTIGKANYDISHLAKGIYFVEILLENGNMNIQKLIIN